MDVKKMKTTPKAKRGKLVIRRTGGNQTIPPSAKTETTVRMLVHHANIKIGYNSASKFLLKFNLLAAKYIHMSDMNDVVFYQTIIQFGKILEYYSVFCCQIVFENLLLIYKLTKLKYFNLLVKRNRIQHDINKVLYIQIDYQKQQH